MTKSEKRAIKVSSNEFLDWLKICRHFFPDLVEWLNSMDDPRNTLYITYTQAVLVLMCVMKNVSAVVTMREMNEAFNEEAAITNLAILAEAPNLVEMPDWQTANNYLERLNADELSEIRRQMIVRLIRTKQFDRFKFQGCWKLVIDGTGYAYFKERHCEHDLIQKTVNKESGKPTILYFHKLLEAKLILSPDIVISIGTEFIENEDENVEKQDCEINAAKRLLKRIRNEYPRLPLCLLGDGLYAAMPFMKLCKEELHMHYIFCLKEGRQKTLYDDFKLLVETEGYRHYKEHLCGEEDGTGAFRNNMEKISGKDQTCNIFEYRHTVTQADGTEKTVVFMWITDLTISKKTLEAFIKCARDRWKIENEGFNNQKNGIYKIEHLCSKEPNAMKSHYLITQIADIMLQLYLAFDGQVNLIKSSVKGIARNIGEFFWGRALDEDDVEYIYRRTTMRLQKLRQYKTAKT